MKIVVLAGGLSPERDVSLASGSLIANALLKNGHEVMLLDAYTGGDGIYYTEESGKTFSYQVLEQEPDLDVLKEQSGNGDALIGKEVLELCQKADLCFVALHGGVGEDGRLQALFDLYGICYTGSGSAGCMLAMDKHLTKQLLRQADVMTADWMLLDENGDALTEAGFGLPCVVKPCGCGSSVGVSLVYTPEELRQALELAKQYEATVLVEKLISGREFSVGVLEGEALPVIEIIPKSGFYDYKNKYQSGLTEEVCPAELTEEERELLQTEALRVHRVLQLGDYSRVDFILDASGEAYCLEANTLPGMTPTSLLPQEAKAAGISYETLCERIAYAALSR